MNNKISITEFFGENPWLNVSAFARYVGINETLMRQYASGSKRMGQKNMVKINAALADIGNELRSLTIIPKPKIMETKTIRFEKGRHYRPNVVNILQVEHPRRFVKAGKNWLCLKSFTVQINIIEDGE